VKSEKKLAYKMVDNPFNNYHNYLSSRVQSSMFLDLPSFLKLTI